MMSNFGISMGKYRRAIPSARIISFKRMVKRIDNQDGLSFLEMLIATVLSAVLSVAVFDLYVNQHNHFITQNEIIDMQNNGRAAMQQMVIRIRGAGAYLPDGFPKVVAQNSDPDEITIYHSAGDCNIPVGAHTQKKQANPIHVAFGLDLSCLSIGQQVYIYRPSTQTGEWFTITNISQNPGSGWQEIHHGGQELAVDPDVGDILLSISTVRFYINQSDSAHPMLMRVVDGGNPEPYAENIEDLQFIYTLATGDTTSIPAFNDDIRSVNINLIARTDKSDETFSENQGFRTRDYETSVLIRN
jgi:hypothetical protein